MMAATPSLALDLCKEIEEKYSVNLVESTKFSLINRNQCMILFGKLLDTQETLVTIQHKLSDSEFTSSQSSDVGPVIHGLIHVLKRVHVIFFKDCFCKDKWLETALRQGGDLKETFGEIVSDLQWYRSVLHSIVFKQVGQDSQDLAPVDCDRNLSEIDLEALSAAAKSDQEDLKGFLRELKREPVRCGENGGYISVQCLATQLLDKLEFQPWSSTALEKYDEGLHEGGRNKWSEWPLVLSVNMQDVRKGPLLGEGSFGSVHETDWLGETYAMKIPKHGHCTQYLELEIKALAGLQHPHVIRLVGCAEEEGKLSYLMERMDKSLSKMLEDCPLPLVQRVDMMIQIAEGVRYLHSKNVVHRDLKPENILVKRDDSGPESLMLDPLVEHFWIAKVSDFGSAKEKMESMAYAGQTTNVGTTMFMAPEMYQLEDGAKQPERFHPMKTDVYSFALICFVVLTSELTPFPFKELMNPTVKAFKDRVRKGKRPELPAKCPVYLSDLIQQCWDGNPVKRPNFDYICTELRLIKDFLLTGAGKEKVSGINGTMHCNTLHFKPEQEEIEGYLVRYGVIGTVKEEGSEMGVRIRGEPWLNAEEILALQIRMSESLRHAVKEVKSFKHECLELDRKVDTLASLLKQAARFSITNPAGLYESPTRQIAMEVEKTLERALGLVKKCRRSGMLKRVITITNVSDFRKVNLYLDNSIANVQYLLNISASGEDRPIHMGLPPIASNEPVLSIVWDNVSIVHVGNAEEKAQGASYLADLAKDSRNASIICEESGVPPLLCLLREGTPAGQEEAARALGYLAADRHRVRSMRKEGAITVFLEILVHGPMKVQAMVCWAISQFCANDPEAQVEIGMVGGIRRLVFLLGHDNVDDLSKTTKAMNIHTVVKTTMTNQKSASGSCREQPDQEGEPGPDSDYKSHSNSLSQITPMPNAIHNNSQSMSAKSTSLENGKLSLQSSSLHVISQNSRDNEDPETKAKLKAEAARALWKLAHNNVQNSKSITDTRALLCFARLIQFENDENDLRYNCIMAVMEIAWAAEHDIGLRRAAFKSNSPATKAVLDQLLRVIENGHPELQVPCLTAMGSLARIFPAPTHVIPPITEALGSWDVAVAAEASRTLYKFANKENYLCVDHSRTILESNGASHLVALLNYLDVSTQTSALNLLCCLSINVPESNLLAQASVLKAVESMTRTGVLSQNIELENNVMNAIAKLKLYQSGRHGNSSTKGTYVP